MSTLRTVSTVIALGALFQLTACKKTDNPVPAPTAATPVNKFADIKTTASFDWSTAQKVSLQVVGMNIPVSDKNYLKVTSTDGQQVYFTQYVAINESINPTIAIPRGTTSVLVTFGSISRTVAVSNNKAVFDYTKN